MSNSIKLYNDDNKNVLHGIPDKSIDLIVTDPPYEMNGPIKAGSGGTVNNLGKFDITLLSLNKQNLTLGYNIENYAVEFIRIMKEPNIYIWCNKKQIPEYLNIYVNEYNCLFDIICWHKTNALPTYSNKYLTDTEYLLYFHKGKGKCFPQSYEDAKTFYLAPINHKDRKLYEHPTIKPLDLTEKIIRNSSKENDTILDCFMGSGTTGVACKNLNRNFIGIEIDEEYFNVAKNRIEKSDKIKKLF